MFRLDGKVALVSGAGRGMGFGVAQCLARQGATVVVNDFFTDRAEAAALSLQGEGLSADYAVADMTNRQAIFDMTAELIQKHGAIDIFVHNAGIPAQGWGYSKFLESPAAEWDSWLQLNLYGLMHASQVILPHMIEKNGPALWPSIQMQLAPPLAWACVHMAQPKRPLSVSSVTCQAKWAVMALLPMPFL